MKLGILSQLPSVKSSSTCKEEPAYQGYKGCSGDCKCQSNDLEVSGCDMRAGAEGFEYTQESIGLMYIQQHVLRWAICC